MLLVLLAEDGTTSASPDSAKQATPASPAPHLDKIAQDGGRCGRGRALARTSATGLSRPPA